LIDAFASLDESYQLIIAGEVYSNLKKYTEQITLSGVADRICFHNHYVKDEDVHVYFSAADVCVLPYRSATQSGITATSFFYELPIIATNVGDFHESIGKPELGLVIEEPHVALLKNALCEYFTAGKKEFYQSNIRKHKVLNSWESYSNMLISFSKSICL
jgi:glycosyltransferase involved in cell wall biosynthesis